MSESGFRLKHRNRKQQVNIKTPNVVPVSRSPGPFKDPLLYKLFEGCLVNPLREPWFLEAQDTLGFGSTLLPMQ